MRVFIFVILTITMTLQGHVALAIPALVVTDLSEPIDLAPYIEYIEDTDSRMTWEALDEGRYEQRWQRNRAPTFIGVNHQSRYWFRVRVQISPSAGLRRDPVVFSPSPPSWLHSLVVRRPDRGDGHRFVYAGNSAPFGERDMPYNQYAFKLPLGAPTLELVGIMDNRSRGLAGQLPLFLMSEQDYETKTRQFDAVILVFYSAMLALLIYNLCLALILRQPLYGLYVLALTSAIAICAAIDGTTLRWFWPSQPMLDERVKVYAIMSSVILFMTFVYYALNRFTFSLRFSKLYKSVIGLGGLGVLYCLLTTSENAQLSHLYLILHLITITGFVIALRHRVPTVAYLFIAEMTAIGGAIFYMMAYHGITQINDVNVWFVHIGFIAEALLLALSLAARTRLAQQAAVNNLNDYINERESKERMDKERLLAQTQANEAQAQRQTRTQFFASMSHEIRTPLTAIKGYAELIQKETATRADTLSHVSTIINSSNHLMKVVNDILDVSKIEAEKIEIESIEVNLPVLLQEIQAYFTLLANDKGIVFDTKIKDEIPEKIVSDPTRIKQILINLCANAVKFTGSGKVSLTASVNKANTKVVFEIEDTGMGMAQTQADKLFQAFVQTDASIGRNYGGTGLGLYLSQQLAENLGGDISVDSELGQGSTFTVTIRLQEISDTPWRTELTQTLSPHLNASLTATIREAVSCSGKVLLAEDNKANQLFIRSFVEDTGATVAVVNNGQQALDYVAENEVDLIIMDMQMPVMDGWAAVKELRSRGFSRPIYALTAEGNPDRLQEYVLAGCNHCLSKPVDVPQLQRTVKEGLALSLCDGEFEPV